MNLKIKIAPVRKSVVVAAAPDTCFDVFTTGIDRWWPKAYSIGASPVRQSIIEPFVGGRWYAKCEDGSDVVVGHVRVWQPAERFVVTFEVGANWKPDARAAFTSEIEVRFHAESASSTRVELEHRDFERMGAEAGEKMHNDVDGGWNMLLDLFANAARSQATERASA